jgi:8-oxo-dGTP pyrophosphatase MutT (NUDIX family)
VATEDAGDPSNGENAGTDNHGAGIGGMPLQVAALPYRSHARGRDILLITSRRSARWILPKGWPQHGTSLAQSAAREAFEEGGIQGTVWQHEIGRFITTKITLDGSAAYPVAVYPLKVELELKIWPESDERQRQWFALAEASEVIASDQREIVEAFYGSGVWTGY